MKYGMGGRAAMPAWPTGQIFFFEGPLWHLWHLVASCGGGWRATAAPGGGGWGGRWHPVAACGGLWRAIATPIIL